MSIRIFEAKLYWKWQKFKCFTPTAEIKFKHLKKYGETQNSFLYHQNIVINRNICNSEILRHTIYIYICIESISPFLDHHLQPPAQSIKSYVRDTDEFPKKLRFPPKLPDEIILCTWIL